MPKITNKRAEGNHGLPQDSFRLQTMTALMKSFCGCFTGPGGPNRSSLPGAFLEKSPPGRRRQRANKLLHPGGINLFVMFFYLLPFPLFARLFS
jgi:hypothetical protein